MENAIASNVQLQPELWMVRHESYLSSLARQKLPADFVEDMVQDTFLAALKGVSGFRGHSSERVWLASILNHKIVDHYRIVGSRKGKVIHQAYRISDFKQWQGWECAIDRPEVADISTTLDTVELHRILQVGINKLSTREQQVIRLKMVGYCTEAICSTLDIEEANTFVLLRRARMKMKHYLRHHL